MAEEEKRFPCPVEGCTHEPFETPQARDSHVRHKHPEYVEQKEGAPKVPIVEEDFATLLRKFKIGADLAKNISENVSHTGGSRVFEDPEKLLTRLTLWSSEIPPAKRKNIIEQWFAEKSIDIPPEVQQKSGMTTEQIQKREGTTKESSDVRYVYDTEQKVVRMAKEGERGGTLAQAKELKEMAEKDTKTETESPFIQDGEGNWRLNPKARITGVEYMAYQTLRQSKEKGEPTDPITAMTQAADTWRVLREGLGGGNSAMPAWMTDPATFLSTIKSLTGEGGESSAVKEAMAAMQQTINELKEDQWRTRFEAQQKQIQDVTGVLSKTLETIADMKREKVGRTEMDIIDKLASEGIGLLKSEMPGLRHDIREAVGSIGLPPGKSPQQREDRKQRFREAVGVDREIEELGRKVFFIDS